VLSSWVKDVHILCDKIENELNSVIPGSEVNIHAEPQEINHLKEDEKNRRKSFS